jgi:hypothetical protein
MDTQEIAHASHMYGDPWYPSVHRDCFPPLRISKIRMDQSTSDGADRGTLLLFMALQEDWTGSMVPDPQLPPCHLVPARRNEWQILGSVFDTFDIPLAKLISRLTPGTNLVCQRSARARDGTGLEVLVPTFVVRIKHANIKHKWLASGLISGAVPIQQVAVDGNGLDGAEGSQGPKKARYDFVIQLRRELVKLFTLGSCASLSNSSICRIPCAKYSSQVSHQSNKPSWRLASGVNKQMS